jgi:hypothetical protein
MAERLPTENDRKLVVVSGIEPDRSMIFYRSSGSALKYLNSLLFLPGVTPIAVAWPS